MFYLTPLLDLVSTLDLDGRQALLSGLRRVSFLMQLVAEDTVDASVKVPTQGRLQTALCTFAERSSRACASAAMSCEGRLASAESPHNEGEPT